MQKIITNPNFTSNEGSHYQISGNSQRLKRTWFTLEYPQDVIMTFEKWGYEGDTVTKIYFLTNKINQKYIKVDCEHGRMLLDLYQNFYFSPLENSSKEMEKRLFSCIDIYTEGRDWSKELSRDTAKSVVKFIIDILQENHKNFLN